MTDLTELSEKELYDFIRSELMFDDLVYESLRSQNIDRSEHFRFEMSGYETNKGECTVNNQNILNKFAHIGIYDYTNYLFLDFYKGIGTLYFQYFGDDIHHKIDLSGFGTVGIIYEILCKTVFSGKGKRRRN
jgi:hypothetical protein